MLLKVGGTQEGHLSHRVICVEDFGSSSPTAPRSGPHLRSKLAQNNASGCLLKVVVTSGNSRHAPESCAGGGRGPKSGELLGYFSGLPSQRHLDRAVCRCSSLTFHSNVGTCILQVGKMSGNSRLLLKVHSKRHATTTTGQQRKNLCRECARQQGL